MGATGERQVLYRQGTGFWRMTAKWVLVLGGLYLVDGGLLRSWGDALVWPLIGVVLYAPFGIGVVWYPKKDQRVTLTPSGLRIRRRRLQMEDVNLLHVARLWLEGRSTADGRPVSQWPRSVRVVWIPLRDGRAYGLEFQDPAAFAGTFGAFAVAACGGPDAVREKAAAATYPEPRPMRARSAGAGSSGPDFQDLFD
ncbi:hypothetical protein [Streptomyces sp. CC77]|uniref:hypothetical protein n=1 Tax=Streptomyces sp. CC77 TaxID=1906739 RepID=UPI0008DD65F9|nr:hypothetical protein [Streptomyces sp. CC77]OII70385.1 hypothetical protein BJP39_13735 [Streptomyces sp. CC77]